MSNRLSKGPVRKTRNCPNFPPINSKNSACGASYLRLIRIDVTASHQSIVPRCAIKSIDCIVCTITSIDGPGMYHQINRLHIMYHHINRWSRSVPSYQSNMKPKPSKHIDGSKNFRLRALPPATGARAKVREFESKRISDFRPRLHISFISYIKTTVTRQHIASHIQDFRAYSRYPQLLGTLERTLRAVTIRLAGHGTTILAQA